MPAGGVLRRPAGPCHAEGVRLLTYYLARHRRHLPEALECLPGKELERMGHVLLKYDDPDFNPQKCFEGKQLPSSVSGDELLATAIDLVEMLIRFYRWMVEQPLGERAGSLFHSLLQIEERHVIELRKIKAMDYF